MSGSRTRGTTGKKRHIPTDAEIAETVRLQNAARLAATESVIPGKKSGYSQLGPGVETSFGDVDPTGLEAERLWKHLELQPEGAAESEAFRSCPAYKADLTCPPTWKEARAKIKLLSEDKNPKCAKGLAKWMMQMYLKTCYGDKDDVKEVGPKDELMIKWDSSDRNWRNPKFERLGWYNTAAAVAKSSSKKPPSSGAAAMSTTSTSSEEDFPMLMDVGATFKKTDDLLAKLEEKEKIAKKRWNDLNKKTRAINRKTACKKKEDGTLLFPDNCALIERADKAKKDLDEILDKIADFQHQSMGTKEEAGASAKKSAKTSSGLPRMKKKGEPIKDPAKEAALYKAERDAELAAFQKKRNEEREKELAAIRGKKQVQSTTTFRSDGSTQVKKTFSGQGPGKISGKSPRIQEDYFNPKIQVSSKEDEDDLGLLDPPASGKIAKKPSSSSLGPRPSEKPPLRPTATGKSPTATGKSSKGTPRSARGYSRKAASVPSANLPTPQQIAAKKVVAEKPWKAIFKKTEGNRPYLVYKTARTGLYLPDGTMSTFNKEYKISQIKKKEIPIDKFIVDNVNNPDVATNVLKAIKKYEKELELKRLKKIEKDKQLRKKRAETKATVAYAKQQRKETQRLKEEEEAAKQQALAEEAAKQAAKQAALAEKKQAEETKRLEKEAQEAEEAKKQAAEAKKKLEEEAARKAAAVEIEKKKKEEAERKIKEANEAKEAADAAAAEAKKKKDEAAELAAKKEAKRQNDIKLEEERKAKEAEAAAQKAKEVEEALKAKQAAAAQKAKEAEEALKAKQAEIEKKKRRSIVLEKQAAEAKKKLEEEAKKAALLKSGKAKFKRAVGKHRAVVMAVKAINDLAETVVMDPEQEGEWQQGTVTKGTWKDLKFVENTRTGDNIIWKKRVKQINYDESNENTAWKVYPAIIWSTKEEGKKELVIDPKEGNVWYWNDFTKKWSGPWMFLENERTQQKVWSSTRKNPIGNPPPPEVQFEIEKLHNLSTQYFGRDDALEDIPHQHEEGDMGTGPFKGTPKIHEDEQIPSHNPPGLQECYENCSASTKEDVGDEGAVVDDTGFDKWCAYQHTNCSLKPAVRAKFLSILTKHDQEEVAVSSKKSSKKAATTTAAARPKRAPPSLPTHEE